MKPEFVVRHIQILDLLSRRPGAAHEIAFLLKMPTESVRRIFEKLRVRGGCTRQRDVIPDSGHRWHWRYKISRSGIQRLKYLKAQNLSDEREELSSPR